MSEPQKGRIAIKLGSAPAPSKPPFKAQLPPPALGKRSRSTNNRHNPNPTTTKRAWGDDSDSDDAHASGKHESITGFGVEGAENDKAVKEAKREYVIARQPNRDWKALAKSQRRGGAHLLPAEARARRDGEGGPVEAEPADDDKGMKWGLTIMTKKPENEDRREEDPSQQTGVKEETPPLDDGEKKTTADQEAMDALLGLTPAAQAKTIHLTEADAFQRDVRAAGDAPTLEDYEAMPVEEFGAALLRGMGWNGEERAPKRKEVKRRPNRLGLGAKELKDPEDLGAWNQGGGPKKKRPRLDEYRREEERKKEGRRRHDDGDDDRKRESLRDAGSQRDRERDRDRHRHQDRHHEHNDRPHRRDSYRR